ncbi:hypothetical protein [Nocardiopsis synnemataformans]|uniref:hypothetical protein n=1 Tax=Nocardiopsis synnemataformans TaxID=61305 RepID=UPI003EB6B01E
MSNPTLATKLVALVKGIFGRKETAATPEPAAQEADGTPQSPAPAPAETEDVTARSTAADEAVATEAEKTEAAEPAAKQEPATAEVKAEEPAAAEPAEPVKPAAKKKPAATAKPAAKKKPEETPATSEAPATPEVVEPSGAEEAGSGREERTEPAAPATADVPEEGAAIAEELAAAEAHTKVSSDEILERVRKGAAPSLEDLAVPTYDELTLPSVRARLRKLTIEQVRELRAYEVAHQSRPEFIKMYDNRIAKLKAEA